MTAVTALFCGICLSLKLWLNEGRFFPLISPFTAAPALPAPFDKLLLLLSASLAVFWLFKAKRILGLLFMGTIILILLQDQMRWQPWVYLYLLMFVPYVFQRGKYEDETATLTVLQWLVAGVYVWSGIHKFNGRFIEDTFAQFSVFAGKKTLPPKWQDALYLIPLTEATTGILLLLPRLRKAGIVIALLIHVFILYFLWVTLSHHNVIVYPWNVAMMFFVVLLFGGVHNPTIISIKDIVWRVPFITPVILVWLFPVLNFWGLWDHYLSFSLYSNKPSSFYIAVESKELSKIDGRLKDYFADIPGLEGGQVISMEKWALGTLNVPFYPEQRLFKMVASGFCNLGIPDQQIIFLESYYIEGKQRFNSFTCKDISVAKSDP